MQDNPVLPEDGRQSPQAAAIQRGVRRLMWALGFATVTELVLANGRRADVTGVTDKGEIWIVEIKSSVADFRSDFKWPEYRDYCDRLLFAVDREFPLDLLPADTGLLLADQYGAELLRDAPLHSLPGARRKAMTIRFARAAALRLHALADPAGLVSDPRI
ncbi:MAG: MmcB family DNA repair protein [Hyphomicrobiaceae bacterium]